jgi:TrmH family RNA methyltransferase
MITSKQNPKIKWVRALQNQSRSRKEENLFVVEGTRLVEEALYSSWPARLVLYTDELSERGQSLVDNFCSKNVPVELVSQQVMRTVSDTETPQGILVVLQWQTSPLPKPLDFIFIADGVRDPGNLGTMLRTAAAAGVQAFFTVPGTVDFLAPKVVRSAMGAHFQISIQSLKLEQIQSLSSDMHYYPATVHEGHPYTRIDFRQPTALIIGGEAEGISSQAYQIADVCIHIPMPGQSESLNAAVAAGVLLFEVARQRSNS